MHIYFIRHGQTEFNKNGVHQDPSVPLSDIGRTQIEKTATRLTELPITKLVASDFTRARESAEIIGREIGCVPEPSELFREVRRPSEVYGKKHISFASARAGVGLSLAMLRGNVHYADEENLYDVRERVRTAVQFLIGLQSEHDHVAVVSHAFIIQFFMRYMCGGGEVHLRDYILSVMGARKLHNASISTVTYEDDKNPGTCDWVLTSHNDYAHLIES